MNKTKSIIAALLVVFGVGTYVGYAKHTGWYPNGSNPIPEFENYEDFYPRHNP